MDAWIAIHNAHGSHYGTHPQREGRTVVDGPRSAPKSAPATRVLAILKNGQLGACPKT